MISFDKVSFAYDDAVIKNCSFTVSKGEKISLMGASGLGKTTVLELISGKLKPQKGTVSVRAQSISMVFQEPRLIPWLTAAENVRIVHKDKDRAEAEKWLRLAGLEGYENALPHELSGGMQQRVSIARALAHGGELFLLDEPFSALDDGSFNHMASLINEHTEGKTLVIVTHRPEQAKLLASKHLTLSGGTVIEHEI